MSEDYDVTELHSKFIKRIKLTQESAVKCPDTHIWDVLSDPSEPLLCIICGAEYLSTPQQRSNLRYNLENLTGADG